MVNHSLQTVIGKNVVELDFVRRHPKMGWANIRGMFGTTNPSLLNSDFGFQVINFKPPKGVGMGYDYKQHNLCVIFDIFRQEYRVFGAEQVNIHKLWPMDTPENIEAFKTYFYDYIINMSDHDKLKFMGYMGPSALPTNAQPIQKNVTVGDKLKNFFNKYVSRIKNFFSSKKSI